MRKIIALLAAALAFAPSASCSAPKAPSAQLYYIVFLRPRADRVALSPAARERIQAAHMANIHKMANEGILAAAGPMDDNPTTIGGIFVFRMGSLAEVERLAASDSTVVERRNTVDVHPWLGPEGMGDAYFRRKRENPAAQDTMAAHAFCVPRRGHSWTDGAKAAGANVRFLESLRSADLVLPW